MYILALSEGSWVSIGTVIVMAFITAFMRNKAKADKADNMIDVDNKIDCKLEKGLKPVHKRIDAAIIDIKETSSDIKNMKEDINHQKTLQAVTETKMDAILQAVTEIKEHITRQ